MKLIIAQPLQLKINIPRSPRASRLSTHTITRTPSIVLSPVHESLYLSPAAGYLSCYSSPRTASHRMCENNFKTLTKHVHMSDLWRICSKCQTPFQDAMRMTLILLSASAYSQTRIILTVWPRVGSCVVVFMRGLSSPLSRTIALMSSFDQLFVIAKYFQCRYRLLREVRGHQWLPVHSHLDML